MIEFDFTGRSLCNSIAASDRQRCRRIKSDVVGKIVDFSVTYLLVTKLDRSVNTSRRNKLFTFAVLSTSSVRYKSSKRSRHLSRNISIDRHPGNGSTVRAYLEEASIKQSVNDFRGTTKLYHVHLIDLSRNHLFPLAHKGMLSLFRVFHSVGLLSVGTFFHNHCLRSLLLD